MRKWNSLLTVLIFLLFLLHAVFGSLQMLGVGKTVWKSLAWVSPKTKRRCLLERKQAFLGKKSERYGDTALIVLPFDGIRLQ